MEFSLVMDHDFSKVPVTESCDMAAMHAVQTQCQSLPLVPFTLVLHPIHAGGKDWET